MGKEGNRRRGVVAVFLSAILIFALPASAADLQPQAARNYERYIALTQVQVEAELAEGSPYLWVERLPEARRAEALTELRNGGVVIERLQTLDKGSPISAPGGLIHHWIGTAFAPGATLAQTLAFMEDYDHKREYFKPDIVRSKILQQEGDDYFVLLRFYQKKIITTVIDTDQQIHYHVVDKTHAWSRSHATRVQEVENPGKSDERLEPEGHDRGFVWKLNTFWRFEQSGMPGDFIEPRHTDRAWLDGWVVRVQRTERVADIHADHGASRACQNERGRRLAELPFGPPAASRPAD